MAVGFDAGEYCHADSDSCLLTFSHFEALNSQDTRANCKLAFETAEKLGIPRVIEPADMVSHDSPVLADSSVLSALSVLSIVHPDAEDAGFSKDRV